MIQSGTIGRDVSTPLNMAGFGVEGGGRAISLPL